MSCPKFLYTVLIFLLPFRLLNSQYIHTPEGWSVEYVQFNGTPTFDEAWAQDIINRYSLDAVIVGSPTRDHNCHGYAWSYTENVGEHWIQYNDELKFFDDASYSNDRLPSYIPCSEAEATHACYEPYSDHSIRVIQNNYPISANGSKIHISKWNDGPLVLHGVRGDYYAADFEGHNGYPVPIRYFKLKTNHSGTLSNYPKTWIGAGEITHSLDGYVYVSSTSSLNIKMGAKIQFNTYYILSTGGAINVEDDFYFEHPFVYLKQDGIIKGIFPTIQSAIDNALPYQTIDLQADYSSFNESISLNGSSHITIIGNGATINGSINLMNSSYCKVEGLHLSSGSIIYVSGGNGNQINNCRFDNSTGIIHLYNTTYCLVNNISATNGDPGEFACNISGSTGNVSSSSNIEGYACGVFVGYNSSFNVTDDYFCNNAYDVDAENGGFAYVENNIFSKINPISILGNCYIADNPNEACFNSVMVKTISGNTQKQSEISVLDDDIQKLYLDIIRRISKDGQRNYKELKSKYKPEFEKIIGMLNNKLSKENSLYGINQILTLLSHCYKWLNESPTFYAFVTNLLSNSKFSSYSTCIMKYQIDNLIDIQDYKRAILLADEILKIEGVDQDLVAEMLYEKGIINMYYLKNNSEAERSFSLIISMYPKHVLAKMAKGQLSNLPQKSDRLNLKVFDKSADELKCSNYPNPFNPITRFNFSIPKDGFTELKIYNSLGQEVATLVSENLTKGQYSLDWNANRYSSGIYFYTLKCGDIVINSKIILIK